MPGSREGLRPSGGTGAAAVRGFLGCCSPQGAAARALQRAALPVPSSGDAVTSHGGWQRTRSRLREAGQQLSDPVCVHEHLHFYPRLFW